MKKLLLLTITTVYYLSAFATPQAPDKLIYNGKEYTLLSYLLEPYFERYPDKRPDKRKIDTTHWREYVATFEINNNELFLKDIKVIDVNCNANKIVYISALKEVFPDQERIKFDWYKGLLVVPYNEKHEGLYNFQNYYLFEIDNGNIVKEKNFTMKEFNEFKQQQFEIFEKTDKYQEVMQQEKEASLKIEKHIKEEIEILRQSEKYRKLSEKEKKSYLDGYTYPKFSDEDIRKGICYNVLDYITKIIE